MKIFFIISFFVLITSCTHYSTTPITNETVIVSKTTNVLGLFGGTIYTCRQDSKGVIIDCRENKMRSAEEKLLEDFRNR